MIKREIEIDGRKVPFRASAAIPRLYRSKFKRDIFRDLMQLQKSIDENEAEASEISLDNLDLFENVAYIMAKHADPDQPDTPEEWLDQFNTFSIYLVFPQLLELWHMNIQTDIEAKKTEAKQPGDDNTALYAARRATRDKYPGS